MKKKLKTTVLTLLVLFAFFTGFIWWKLQPQVQNLALPAHLVGIDSPQGLALLESADSIADYRELAMDFQSQELISFCGVASAVTVLNTMGRKTTQDDFFTSEASQLQVPIYLGSSRNAVSCHAGSGHGDGESAGIY